LSNLVSGEKKGTGISIFIVVGVAGFALGAIVVTAALLYVGTERDAGLDCSGCHHVPRSIPRVRSLNSRQFERSQKWID